LAAAGEASTGAGGATATGFASIGLFSIAFATGAGAAGVSEAAGIRMDGITGYILTSCSGTDAGDAAGVNARGGGAVSVRADEVDA
jgi:hypothetical protein